MSRQIGTDTFPAIGFGLMGLSTSYGVVESDEERFKVLDAAVEEGCTFWDSSDIYGDNEDLLGKWFKRTGNRSKIFLATKFGVRRTDQGTILSGKPAYVKEAVEKSLKRLGVDVIDLYYLHRVDQTVPIEKTVGAMAELVKEGKVRYLGLSECSAATLRRAHAVHPISAVQVEYSPFFLDIEDDEKIGLMKACRELGVKIVAYSPLGRGLLTGVYRSYEDFPADDFRRSIPKFFPENFPNILKISDGLHELGEKHNATAGQVTLAWLLAQGDDIIPIPGTKKIKYLKENFGALKVHLSPEDVRLVRDIVDKSDACSRGMRYPPQIMALSFVDTPELENE